MASHGVGFSPPAFSLRLAIGRVAAAGSPAARLLAPDATGAGRAAPTPRRERDAFRALAVVARRRARAGRGLVR
ncbi:MAG TPA: hypothetical protein VIW03_02425 [Anaeromyxobacter sp.]